MDHLPMLNEEQVAELERLDKAATPGPWEVEGTAVPRGRGYLRGGEGSGITSKHKSIVIGGAQDEQGGAVGFERQSDAELTIAARNALPELLRVWRESQWRPIETAPKDVSVEYWFAENGLHTHWRHLPAPPAA